VEVKEKIPVKPRSVASRIIDKEAVVVLLDKQETIVFNEVGSRIWEIMDGKKNIAELAYIIASEFDTSYPQALQDTVEFAKDLEQRGIVLIK